MSNEKNEENELEFIIVKQVAVKAKDAETALEKMKDGKTLSLNINPRPQPQPQPQAQMGLPIRRQG